MPTLDVRKVLFNDKFRDDNVVVIRKTETVNEHGEAVLNEQRITISAVVIQGYSLPGGDGGLVRTPEAERFSNGITIATTFPLQGGDTTLGITADTIAYMGATYVVSAQNDYSNFDGGYILCLCDQVPLNP